jgi:hypothetical protein
MHSCPHCASLVRAGSTDCPHCSTSLLSRPVSRTAAAVLMGLTLTALPGCPVAKYGGPPSDSGDTSADVAPQK